MTKSFDPLVSIVVIDYKKNNPYLIECLDAIQTQTYQNFEIILVSDHSLKLIYPKLKILDFKGRYTPPAKKRDFGAKVAKGEILAFIDDDAFPSKTWLKNVVPHFRNPDTVGVGGPGVTPPKVSWREEASGWASASPVGSGPHLYRFLSHRKKYVEDFPSMNLAVRKVDFKKVGGFDSNFWPGEDTKLCLDLTHKLKKRIVYEPKAVVFHHRRPILLSHLKQNGSFGLHRGFFARILPATSFKPVYFLPSLLLIGLCFLVLSYFLPGLRTSTTYLFALYGFLLYLVFLILNSIWIYFHSKSILQLLLSVPVIFITHLWYGAKFIQGYLFTGKLLR